MAKCSGITKSGTACKGTPIDDSPYCFVHHPDHVEERRRYGSKGGKRGGRGRPAYEVGAIKALLSDLTENVLSGKLETSRAAVANQLINTHLRAIEQERRVKETEELESRIEALERAQGTRKEGQRPWGA
jgi:hypothetical protein